MCTGNFIFLLALKKMLIFVVTYLLAINIRHDEGNEMHSKLYPHN